MAKTTITDVTSGCPHPREVCEARCRCVVAVDTDSISPEDRVALRRAVRALVEVTWFQPAESGEMHSLEAMDEGATLARALSRTDGRYRVT